MYKRWFLLIAVVMLIIIVSAYFSAGTIVENQILKLVYGIAGIIHLIFLVVIIYIMLFFSDEKLGVKGSEKE